MREFLSDLRLWDEWCRALGANPADSNAAVVAEYVRALSGAIGDRGVSLKPRAAATIARYLVYIGWAYRMAGREDPAASPLVRLELKAARKAVGTRQRQARAIRYKGDVVDLDGLATGTCLDTLLKATRRDLLGDRDRALLRVAYDTGCRRSELVGINVTEIQGPDADGAGTPDIASSKTDREKAGALAYLSPATMRAIALARGRPH